MRLQLTGAALLVQISRGGGGSFGGVRRPQLKRKPFGDRILHTSDDLDTEYA